MRGLCRPQWRSERHDAYQRGTADLNSDRRGHHPNPRNTADDVGRWLLQTALEGFDRVRGSESGIAHGRAMVKDRFAGLNAMQWANARCAQGVEPGH